MQRTRVDSSVIAAVGYDRQRRALEVEFRSGRVYDYYGVPERLFDEMLRAPSVGSYFNRQIRTQYRAQERTSRGGSRIKAR